MAYTTIRNCKKIIVGDDCVKKVKYFLLTMLVLLLTTGCDGVYNVEIYNGSYKEDITITEKNSNNWDDVNENGVSFREQLDAEYNRDNHYYDKMLISNSTELGLNYKSNFNLIDYSSLGIGYRCYQYFRAVESDGIITIMTSNRNTCYDHYKWLDNITINVKTNHKVINNNADKVDGDTYTWYLTRENASDKSLEIRLSSNDYVYNYNNEVVNQLLLIFGIIAGVIIIIIIILVVFKIKGKRANKI
jgi:hypothetical protein